MSWYKPVPAHSHPSLPSIHCSPIPRTQLKLCHVSNMSSNALSVESGPNSSASLQALPSAILSHTLNRRTTQQPPTPGLCLPGPLSGVSDPHSYLDISWMVPRHVKFSMSQIELIIFHSLPLLSNFLLCPHIYSVPISLHILFSSRHFFPLHPLLNPFPTFFLSDSHPSFKSQLSCCFL